MDRDGERKRDGGERKVKRKSYSKRDKNNNLQSKEKIQKPTEMIFTRRLKIDLIGAKFGKLLAND